MRRALSLLALVAACSPPLADDAAAHAIENRCVSDAECSAGAVCAAGACYAHGGDLARVVLEVVPDSTAAYGAGVSFLVDQPSVGDGDLARDVTLPARSVVRGHVEASALPNGCKYAVAADGSLEVRVQLVRTDAALGLPRATFAANATSATVADAPGSWSFEVDAVPGTYDVHVLPLHDDACPVAPLLVVGAPLAPGDVSLLAALAAPAPLTGSIVAPADASLEGWSVDIIEPALGRRLSTVARLGAGDPTNFALTWRPAQALHAMTDPAGGTLLSLAGAAAGASGPLLRVSPPDGVVAPTLLWDLAAADLQFHGKVGLDTSSLRVLPRAVSGGLRGSTGARPPVRGALSIVALGGQAGLTAAFATSVATRDDGTFVTALPPGAYRVFAVPDASEPWALTEAKWFVTADGGDPPTRVVDLLPQSEIAGRATLASTGEPIAGASVDAVAAIDASPTAVLDAALGNVGVAPRGASDFAGLDGAFRSALDPGVYHVSVRPPATSGLPWFVSPRTTVAPAGDAAARATLDARVAFAVPLGGLLRAPDGTPAGGALVRAWAAVTGAGAVAGPDVAASGVVQVAESRSGADGRYRVLLPARFAP